MTKQAHERLVEDRRREMNAERNARGLPAIGEPPSRYYGSDRAAYERYMASAEGRGRLRIGR